MSDVIINSYISFPGGGGGPPPGPTQYTISGAGHSALNATDYEDSGATNDSVPIYISRTVNEMDGYIGFIHRESGTWYISMGGLVESVNYYEFLKIADVNGKMALSSGLGDIEWSSSNSRWELIDSADQVTVLDYSSVTTDYFPPVTGWGTYTFFWNPAYYLIYSNDYTKNTPPLTADQAWSDYGGEPPVPTVTET